MHAGFGSHKDTKPRRRIHAFFPSCLRVFACKNLLSPVSTDTQHDQTPPRPADHRRQYRPRQPGARYRLRRWRADGGDADTDLAAYPDASFDYAVLSQTLQTTRRPDIMLDQLLRIGRQAFVSFPNFAHWRIRMSLLLRGRMPVTRLIPQSWYDTPNIHHVTIEDFRALVEAGRYAQEGQWFLSGDKQTSEAAANLLAEHAVFLLRG